jgi:hypothetical protein
LKRIKALTNIAECAEAGRAPKPHISKHVNWTTLAGQLDPRVVLTDVYIDIYGFPVEEERLAHEQRQHWITLGKFFNIDNGRPFVTRGKLDKALGKLKRNKGSPDGITAEVLQALPEDCKDQIATGLSRRCAVLDLPREWCSSLTSSAPKVIGATSLAKCRPIAGLCALRKP